MPMLRKASSHTAAALLGAVSSLAALTILDHGHDNGDSNNKNHNSETNNNTEIMKQNGQKEIMNAQMIAEAVAIPSLPFVQPPITFYQPNPNLQIAYDARTKNPIYALEKLCFSSNKSKMNDVTILNGADGDKGNNNNNRFQFHEQKSLSPQHRSKNAYYRNSGYDRGHLAPAADFKYDSNHKRDTFSLTNISPQHPTFNRVVWLKLEEWVRSLVPKLEKDVYVISGPIWLPTSKLTPATTGKNNSGNNNKDSPKRKDLFQYTYNGLGTPPNIIHVPTHFFKLIFTMNEKRYRDRIINENTGSTNGFPPMAIEHFAAFVVPNDSFEKNNNDNDEIKLIDCLVKVKDLEAVTGVSFFQEDQDSNDYDNGDIFDLLTELVWYEHGQYGELSNSMINGDPKSLQNQHHKQQHRWRRNKFKNVQKKLDNYFSRTNSSAYPKHICSGDSNLCHQISLLNTSRSRKK